MTKSTSDISVETIPQLLEFLNLVYLSYNPNSKMYEEQPITINGLSKVWGHSNLFADKSATSFNKWCSKRNVKFFTQETKRRKNDFDQRVSVRSLYVIKDEHISKSYMIHTP